MNEEVIWGHGCDCMCDECRDVAMTPSPQRHGGEHPCLCETAGLTAGHFVEAGLHWKHEAQRMREALERLERWASRLDEDDAEVVWEITHQGLGGDERVLDA